MCIFKEVNSCHMTMGRRKLSVNDFFIITPIQLSTTQSFKKKENI